MTTKHNIQFAFTAFVVLLFFYACANRGQGPTGGKKDIIPPKVMKSFPVNGSLYFDKKEIQIEFDENVSIEKASDNVVISPPQVKPPEVKSYGKRVQVKFEEELKDSTTYSINFGNAIQDLNEKNPIKNYVFSFSTGKEIDTLRVSGTVINAEDLSPMPNVFVGIYVDRSDSVFFSKPFLRIGRTDEYGRFSIDNVKKGTYKVFALGDVNRDYFYQPGEGIGLFDSIVEPTFRIEPMQDTIWRDSITYDSIRTYMGTHFLPDDVTISFFKENKKRQYLVKNERKSPYSFSLFFNTELPELPQIKPLNFEWEGKYMLQKNNTRDSLTYWLTDSLLWKADTLRMAVSFLKTDSVFQLYQATDTISITLRGARANTKAKSNKKNVVPKIEPLRFNNNITGTFEVYNPVILTFEEPLADIDISKIKLSQKVDTLYKNIPFKWRQVDSTKMIYAIDNKWIAEEGYSVTIDSACFKSIYAKTSNKFNYEFKIRSLEEYSSLKLFASPANPKVVFQALDNKDEVLSSKPANTKGTLFEYLKPGDYYLRLFIDENGNGKWDTGDLRTHRHPEKVYYYPKKITLKANWEFEETWNYLQLPVLEQKPIELIKKAANANS